ncbi:MAG TPA: hypothetical protein V6D19_19360 [Stenomitos sp.]
MQYNISARSTSPQQQKGSKKAKPAQHQRMPLKQRMAAILEQDRQSINEPLAHLQKLYFSDSQS